MSVKPDYMGPIEPHPRDDIDAEARIASKPVAHLIEALEEFVESAVCPGNDAHELLEKLQSELARNGGGNTPLPVARYADMVFGKLRHEYVQALRSNYHRPPESNLAILELACGKSPALGQLIWEHAECDPQNPCCEFQNRVSYTGCDIEIPLGVQQLHKSIAEQVCPACFGKVDFCTCDLTVVSQLHELRDRGPWDIIILTNALHELPPAGWPFIIASVTQMLRSHESVFLLVDRDVENHIRNDESNGVKDAFGDKFWETGAIWISKREAVDLMKAASLNVGNHHLSGGKRDFWIVRASKAENKDYQFDGVVEDLWKHVVQLLKSQHQKAEQEIAGLRTAVVAPLNSNADLEGRVLATLKYLTRFATDKTRVRAIGRLEAEFDRP